MNKKVYDVLYIGNYTKDTIITPRETKNVDGGAVNYAARQWLAWVCSLRLSLRLAREDQHVVDGFKPGRELMFL